MPVLDLNTFDFRSLAHTDTGTSQRLTATVRNEDTQAILHVGVKSPVPWLDIYPSEFALAPQTSQSVVAELRPDLAGNIALAPVSVTLFGQYLALTDNQAGTLPPEITQEISVLVPLSNCPHCAADLPEGARECRRCGERIRLCPVCGVPNTWLARNCRQNPAHVIRTERDWLTAPGGDAAHSLSLSMPLGTHLARRWSCPSYPTSQGSGLEWCAPVVAFGLVAAAAIDSAQGRATLQAFEIATGAPLWEFDLPDSKGIYPDRGGLALSSDDGSLYAATLGGSVIALDVIRGTRRWQTTVETKPVYGGVTVSDDLLLVPGGTAVSVLDRHTGVLQGTLVVSGRLDTAIAATEGGAFAASDDGAITGFRLDTCEQVWKTETDGPFDAAPLVQSGTVYAVTMTGTVYACDTRTGALRWKTSVSDKGSAATPALSADGLLFIASDDGYVHIVDAARGNLIRSRRISNTPLRTSPVCSGHTVFLGADDGNVYTMDADYNVLRAYETTTGARIATAGFALYGDTLAVPATNGLLYVLRAIP